MPNRFQIKRTTTTGLLPNVSNSSNTSYIAAGELAINLTDRKLLSSNGSATFEIGANLASIVVGTAFTQTSGNANFDSGVLFVDGTNNRVGIGTTGPVDLLTVNRSSGSGITSGISLTTVAGGVGDGSYIKWTGDVTNEKIARIDGVLEGTDVGSIRFNTGNGADGFAERMRIDASGSVGIARVPDTSFALDVGGEVRIINEVGGGFGGAFRLYNASAGATNPAKHFRVGSTGNWEIINSAYNAVIAALDDSGNFNLAGTLAAGNTTITGFANVTSTLAAGNTTVTGFVSANNAYANGTTGQSFKATTPGAAQGEKSALTMYATFTGSGDNGPRRVADIVGGYIGGTWGNETLTFHVGTGAQNDNANTTTQRLLVNATSFAANNLAFSGITTLAAGNTSITGFITATGDITAFFSDDRLKDRYSNIPNAVEKVKSLNGFYYEPNITAQDLGYQKEMHVGVSAQEVNAIMPEIVAPAPIDNKYMTVKYDRLIPLLIEAIKEQQIQIDELKAQLKKD